MKSHLIINPKWKKKLEKKHAFQIPRVLQTWTNSICLDTVCCQQLIVKLSFNPLTAANVWVHTQHRSYWCPGAEAQDHQYPQCRLNVQCIGPFSYWNVIFIRNNIRKWTYILKEITRFLRVKPMVTSYRCAPQNDILWNLIKIKNFHSRKSCGSCHLQMGPLTSSIKRWVNQLYSMLLTHWPLGDLNKILEKIF